MDGPFAVHGDLRRVGVPAALEDDPRLAEGSAAILRLRDADVGGWVFADGPGEIDDLRGADGEGGTPCGLRAAPGHPQRIGEARAAVGRAAEPQGTLVLGPGGIQVGLGADGEVQATIVPEAPGETPLAGAGRRVREIHRLAEAPAAVGRAREEDLAAVRAPGEHDLLPQHVHPARAAGAERNPRKPREGAWAPGDVHGFLEPRLPIGSVGLEEDVLPRLIGPGDASDGLAIDRHGGGVHVAKVRLVHAPGPLVRLAGGDLDDPRPAHRRLPVPR